MWGRVATGTVFTTTTTATQEVHMSVTCLARPCDPDPSIDIAAVELRPLEPGDTCAVLEVFAGLDAQSRRLRFLTAKPRLTAGDLRQLTAVDHHDHVAVLAVSTAQDRPIGVARFVRDPDRPESADVAVAVVDAWQGRGVGTMLKSALVRRALEVGVRRFTMAMSPHNEAAVRLLHRAPGEIERLALDDETAEFALVLGDPVPRPWLRRLLARPVR
jgi:RimJ/RimL family protein N-acetyltransferase